MSNLVDPRTITVQTIADACDACVALWIKWMAEPEDWMREHLEKRNVREWVASAARNAWVMHDNCDANMVIIEALEDIGLHSEDWGDLPDDDGKFVYNNAIWYAVAHQGGGIVMPILEAYLKDEYGLAPAEIAQFEQILNEAPEDGLERACQRALAKIGGPISPENVSGVSDQEALMTHMLVIPPDELDRLVQEARKHFDSQA